MSRRLTIVAIAAALLSAWAPPAASAAEARASLPDIEDEVMCTICGTLLAESDSPQADRERALIRQLIAQGQDKDQIKDALVAQYGPRVLATPSGHGFDLLAWLVPGVGIVIAGVAIGYFAVTRSRRRSGEPEPPALEASERSRLDEDMARYDL
ncbi:MAG TPA: cytochrome c-type biogenesis protein [Solirubrobacterales bacterium]|jgi:cytochrome c-type biogenesis protein CcmH